eukprot:4530317-Alexandrium_andersonii.AAC.2
MAMAVDVGARTYAPAQEHRPKAQRAGIPAGTASHMFGQSCAAPAQAATRACVSVSYTHLRAHETSAHL